MISIKDYLCEADAVLIGAGAGLSAAAGLDYAGTAFQEAFGDMISRYGFTDLYTSSFYPFRSEEERWAYWSRHVAFARIDPPALPLYRRLRELVEGKDHFVITTNVDGQFRKAGFAADRLFEVQGDYAYIQPQRGTDGRRFYAEDLFMRMVREQHDCRIPSELVPYYYQGEIRLGDRRGGVMDINIRKDAGFVQDDQWDAQAARYQQFVERHQGHRLLLFELGIGFNTPTIIRFPFERMARQLPCATLVRVNRDYPEASLPGLKRFHAFTDFAAFGENATEIK